MQPHLPRVHRKMISTLCSFQGQREIALDVVADPEVGRFLVLGIQELVQRGARREGSIVKVDSPGRARSTDDVVVSSTACSPVAAQPGIYGKRVGVVGQSPYELGLWEVRDETLCERGLVPHEPGLTSWRSVIRYMDDQGRFS